MKTIEDIQEEVTAKLSKFQSFEALQNSIIESNDTKTAVNLMCKIMQFVAKDYAKEAIKELAKGITNDFPLDEQK